MRPCRGALPPRPEGRGLRAGALGEAKVQQALERVARGRTTIVIAHRLSTIRNAERILVLTRGGIVEEGSHASLLERGGVYTDLYRRQWPV